MTPLEQTIGSIGPAAAHDARPRTRSLRRLLRRGAFALVLGSTFAAGYLAGGFVRFAQEVSEFSRAAAIGRADGIVVLTGGALRLDQAMDLLKDGKARRLLISGVNPGTSARTLSKLTATDRRLFDCCVDLDYAALNTVGNAEMTDRWARRQGFDDLILVTSDYHMPRTLLEFERFAHVPVIKPYAVARADLWQEGGGMPSARGVKVLFVEYAKLLATRLRMAAGMEASPAAVDETARSFDRRAS
ncbi:YdcF family protein [Aureimonas leprariae]|uniref:YdcF family protein n=1 Tax=Plantimonas leprariae TaxID=2615207 RepID=A0A7V7PLB7_9HYPH|nr:YdcF family protein [Aureimonas leprariae]KAB0677029.1 YdcF family protein [Aureimonas leprariae]